MPERRKVLTGYNLGGSGWIIAILSATICVFASLVSVTHKTPAPYELKYPANFGSRFTIPNDNPTTQEGVYLGRMLFYEKKLSANNQFSCKSCHEQKLAFTDGRPVSRGLDSIFTDFGREKVTGQSMDKGRFRVPTLRNILLTAPYMHDGRFKTIEAVLDHYSDHIRQSETLSSFLQDISNEQGGKNLSLSPLDKKDIIAFLGMLTDSTFISNPAFSNPHSISKAQ